MSDAANYVELVETLVSLGLSETDKDAIRELWVRLTRDWISNRPFIDQFLNRANQALLDNSYSFEQRQRLADLMTPIGQPAYPYILALLQNSEFPLQKLGLGMLSSKWFWYDAELLQAVLLFLKSADLEMRRAALKAVTNIFDRRNPTGMLLIAADYFLPSLKSSDEEIRFYAMVAIQRFDCEFPTAEVIENVLVALADPVERVAFIATSVTVTLARHSPEVIDRLLALLENPATLIITKGRVLRALPFISKFSPTKNAEIMAKLWEYWESDDFRLKEVAAVGIAYTQPEFQPAIDFLIENLLHLNHAILETALQELSLKGASVTKAEDNVLALLKDESKLLFLTNHGFYILNILRACFISTKQSIR